MSKQNEPAVPRVPSILPKLDAARQNGEPLTLNINGLHTLVLEDDLLCDQLLDFIDRVEAVEGVRRGMDDFAHGRFRSLEEVVREKREKYGLPD